MGLPMCVQPDPSPCHVFAELSFSHLQLFCCLPSVPCEVLSPPWRLTVASSLPSLVGPATPTATQDPASIVSCSAGGGSYLARPGLLPGSLQLLTNCLPIKGMNVALGCKDT